MPPAKKRKSKAKKVKPTNGELAVKEMNTVQKTLRTEYYIPNKMRAAASSDREKLMDAIIEAVLSESNTSPAADGTTTCQVVHTSKLGQMVLGVGLAPTEEQLQQIEVMAAFQGHVSGSGVGQLLDLNRLRAILDGVMATRVLILDPKYIQADQMHPGTKCASVVYGSGEASIQKCFESLWEVSGARVLPSTSETAMRVISLTDLQSIFTHYDEMVLTSNPLPREVLEALLSSCIESNETLLREDTFLLKFIDVC